MAVSGFKIGIEVETLLTLREPPPSVLLDLEAFGRGLVKRYNQSAGDEYPRMHSDIDGMYDGANENIEWSVTERCVSEAKSEFSQSM